MTPEQRARYETAREALNAGKSRLRIVPCDLADANAFVRQHHRHHGQVVGHKFCLAVADEENRVRGVAIVGRPVARALHDGWTLEVYRVATDGCPNACSALYAACGRVTVALGYRKVITYTLSTEPGTSLRAVGWRIVAEVKGRSWDRPSRPRVDKWPLQDKIRWEGAL